MNGAIKDGVITCSFSRKKTAAAVTGRRKRAAASQSNYFNMDNDWFLLFASGPSAGGNLLKLKEHQVVLQNIGLLCPNYPVVFGISKFSFLSSGLKGFILSIHILSIFADKLCQ